MMSFSLPRARLVAILLGRGLGTCCAALFSVAGLFSCFDRGARVFVPRRLWPPGLQPPLGDLWPPSYMYTYIYMYMYIYIY